MKVIIPDVIKWDSFWEELNELLSDVFDEGRKQGKQDVCAEEREPLERQLSRAEEIIQIACEQFPYNPTFTNALMDYDKKYGINRAAAIRQSE